MEDDALIVIGNKLYELRKEKKITQMALASEFDLKRATYTNWETARVEIPLEILDKLAIFYNVGLDYMFGFSEERKQKIYKKLNFEILASNLNEYKKENNLKLEAFAIDAGTTVSTIWSYLKNKNKILTSYLYNICKSNSLSADYLLGKIDYIPEWCNKENKNR